MPDMAHGRLEHDSPARLSVSAVLVVVSRHATASQRQYIEAAKAAFKRDYAPMIEIIHQALVPAENRQ